MKRFFRSAIFAATAMAAMPALAQPAVVDTPTVEKADPAFVAQLRAALREYPELAIIAVNEAQQKQQQMQMQRLNESAAAYRVSLAAKDSPALVLGNPAGKDTYIEFLDYRCGYCAQMHNVVNDMMSQDIDARFVIMMRPILGPDSETLARFVVAAAGEGKFAEAHNYVYENHLETTDAGLEAAAKALGLDWPTIRSAMGGEKVSSILGKHETIGNELQVQGTPFFITPTKVHPGAVSIDQLKG